MAIAQGTNKVVLPVLLEETQVPFELSSVQAVDMTGGVNSALRILLQSITRSSETDGAVADYAGGQIYLSYSGQDARVAKKIRDYLDTQGFRVWDPQTEIRAGDSFQRVTEEALERSEILIAVLSHQTRDHCSPYFSQLKKVSRMPIRQPIVTMLDYVFNMISNVKSSLFDAARSYTYFH